MDKSALLKSILPTSSWEAVKDDFISGEEDSELAIVLTQPSIGTKANAKIEYACEGFDWEKGLFLIFPDIPLVSWDYLEKIHPGIKDEIEQERKELIKRPVRCIVIGDTNYGAEEAEKDAIRQQLDKLMCPPYIEHNAVEIIIGNDGKFNSAVKAIASELEYKVTIFLNSDNQYNSSLLEKSIMKMLEYATEDNYKWRAKMIVFGNSENQSLKNILEKLDNAKIEKFVINT